MNACAMWVASCSPARRAVAPRMHLWAAWARSTATAKLAKYRSMRDFSLTAEPSGGSPTAHAGHSFVIQQHAARRMHYDFRLELDGVLLSWSVPKGPSLSPTTRRLAVRTEDHPLDYAGFEGIIPAGQYGGGSVIVWDRGRWQPEGDAQAAMAKGRLTFTLQGEKLAGRWHLVKTKSDGKADNWLLFKGRDEVADDKLDIVAAKPESVLSGKTVEQVAAAPERVWQSNRAVKATAADQPVRDDRGAAGQGEARRSSRRRPRGRLPLPRPGPRSRRSPRGDGFTLPSERSRDRRSPVPRPSRARSRPSSRSCRSGSS